MTVNKDDNPQALIRELADLMDQYDGYYDKADMLEGLQNILAALEGRETAETKRPILRLIKTPVTATPSIPPTPVIEPSPVITQAPIDESPIQGMTDTTEELHISRIHPQLYQAYTVKDQEPPEAVIRQAVAHPPLPWEDQEEGQGISPE